MEDKDETKRYNLEAKTDGVQNDNNTEHEDDNTEMFYSPYSSIQHNEEASNTPNIDASIQITHDVQDE